MDEQVKIKKDGLSATIDFIGAELVGLEYNGREYIWQGDEKSWTGHAPVLFPVCGGLKWDTYFLNGKGYPQQKHGFARKQKFVLKEKTENSATFLLSDTPDTRKGFPFAFDFLITYALEGKSLTVEYRVKNKSEDTMYLTIGAHEGYALYDDFENYSILFDKSEELDSYVLDGNLLTHERVNYGKDTKELPLSYEYFAVDATVFKDIVSRKVWLSHKTAGKVLSVEFGDFKHLLLWTKLGARYICIEPWSALQDFVDAEPYIALKPNVTTIDGGNERTWKHKITIEKE